MREVIIDKDTNILKDMSARDIMCPMSYSNPLSFDHNPMACHVNCAWFKLLELQDRITCYCQGKVIGLLKTTD